MYEIGKDKQRTTIEIEKSVREALYSRDIGLRQCFLTGVKILLRDAKPGDVISYREMEDKVAGLTRRIERMSELLYNLQNSQQKTCIMPGKSSKKAGSGGKK